MSNPRRLLALSLAPALVAGAALTTTLPGLASPPPPDPVGTATQASQSLVDGCQRNAPGLFTRNSAQYVYVYNTPSDQPAPAPQWVTGTISSFNPRYEAVHTSGGDLPMGHDAYDYNVNILPDPGYEFLLAGDLVRNTGNYNGGGEEAQRIHTEWEDLAVARFAYAEPGDRVTELGSWVWDCGHWGPGAEIVPPGPDYLVPNAGQRCLVPALDPGQCGDNLSGENTEFHPYRVLWLERGQSPASPYAEKQAELFVSTEKTAAGKDADCAHDNRPPNFSLPLAGLDAPAFTTYYLAYPPSYLQCLTTEPDWQDVSGHYSFLLTAPPKPAGASQLAFHAVDHGSTGNAPAPTLTREGDAVRVTFDLLTSAATKPSLLMGYTVFVGWDAIPAESVPTHLRVSLDKVEVHRAMDAADCRGARTLCNDESRRPNQGGLPPGEWNLYWDVSGRWGQWGRSESDPASQGELMVNDGTVLTGNQAVDLYVAPGQGWRLFMHGRECDLGALGLASGKLGDLGDCPSNQEIADNNDVPGLVLDQYPSAAAGLENCLPNLPACSHRSNARTNKDDPTSTCPDSNVEGCYSLTYSVSLVDDAAARVSNPFAPPGAGPGQLPNTLRAPSTAMPLALVLLIVAATAMVLVPGLARRRATRSRRPLR